MIDVWELRDRIEGMYAEPYSEEGQAVINDPDKSHVLEVWEDGELTSTKCGDLYRQRNLHASKPPLLTEKQRLFEVPEGKEHQRMVVTDRRLVEILDEYRDLKIDKALIDYVEAHSDEIWPSE